MKKIYFIIVFISFSIITQAQEANLSRLFNQAKIASETGYYDDAIKIYKEILEQTPQSVGVYIAIGNLYIKKGQEVSNLKNALLYFNQYLIYNPNGSDIESVQGSIDRIEFLLEKEEEKEFAKQNFQGRWASLDGDDDIYGRSLFIIDINEIGGKIKIDLEPSSIMYSPNFVNKTAYADLTDDGQYAFYFTDDHTYMPSQAKYDFNRSMINQSTYSISSAMSSGAGRGVTEGLGVFFNYLNSSKQEKDLAKNTRKTYEFKINPISNGRNEIECLGHFLIKESTQLGEKVFVDSLFFMGFCKVRNDYKNGIPIGINKLSNKEHQENYRKEGDRYVMNLNNIEVVEKQALKSNPELFKIYKSGNRQKNWGTTFGIIGSLSTLAGILIWYSGNTDLNDAEEDRNGYSDHSWYDDEYKNDIKKEQIIPGQILTFGGIGMLSGGIILHKTGKKKKQKAIHLYNESVINNAKNKRVSELRIGTTKEGLGLAFSF